MEQRLQQKNIESGTYKISRPFNVVTKDGLSETAQDFLNFIMSSQGQEVVADEGYIPVETSTEYSASGLSGKVTVSGSSSVSPVMEKLSEAYKELNKDVEVEIQTSDSTTGVSNAIEGISDIGMASRELKDSETSEGVKATVIATDGIAVIVSNDNSVEELTSDQVKQIFTGETTSWDEGNEVNYEKLEGKRHAGSISPCGLCFRFSGSTDLCVFVCKRGSGDVRDRFSGLPSGRGVETEQ